MEGKAQNGNSFFGFAAKGIAVLAVFVLLGAIMAGCTQAGQPQAQDKAVPDKIGLNSAENKTGYEKVNATIAQAIADGTYSDNATYAYHNGTETVEFSVTVKGDVVESVSVSGTLESPVSEKIVGKFKAALPDLVVGKKITELNLPKNVAGSSLTNAAFKEYVEGIVEKY